MYKNKYARMFVQGGLMVPEKITKKETFAASKNFSAPKTLILDGYCTPVENQGNLPFCAAYSASGFAENLLWRKNHYHEDIDPVPLYKYAKTIDGSPNTPGTFLECTMEALLKKGYFDEKKCQIKQFGGSLFGNGNAIRDMKFAIHQYGIAMVGFNITSEWYNPGRKNTIEGLRGASEEGGHAVLCCGYDENRFLIMNSWGKDYAQNGFVWITYEAFQRQFMYATVMTHTLDD